MEQYEFRFIGIQSTPINNEIEEKYWIAAIESTAHGSGLTLDEAIYKMIQAAEHMLQICKEQNAQGTPIPFLIGEDRMEEDWVVRDIAIFDSIMNDMIAEQDEEDQDWGFIGSWFVAGKVYGNEKDGLNVKGLRVLEREGYDVTERTE